MTCGRCRQAMRSSERQVVPLIPARVTWTCDACRYSVSGPADDETWQDVSRRIEIVEGRNTGGALARAREQR